MLTTHRARIVWLIALALSLTIPTLVSAKGGKGKKVKEEPVRCHFKIDKNGNPKLKGVKAKDLGKHTSHSADTVPMTFYCDKDGDGWGDPSCAKSACKAGKKHVDKISDCDDTDAAVHPGASEVADDGIDNNCDGVSETGPPAGVACPCNFDLVPKMPWETLDIVSINKRTGFLPAGGRFCNLVAQNDIGNNHHRILASWNGGPETPSGFCDRVTAGAVSEQVLLDSEDHYNACADEIDKFAAAITSTVTNTNVASPCPIIP